MTAVEAILVLIIAAGFVYTLFSLFCVIDFFRTGGGNSGDPPAIRDQPVPVSILKPLKGLDPSSRDNLLSFCTQDYPSYEILFGFREEDDPALPLVRQIAASMPGNARIVVSHEGSGPNQKVLNLEAMAADARFPLLAISDSDMHAEKDYLRRVVEEFSRCATTGMVTCLYKISDPASMGSALESYTIALDFIPSVLVAARIEGVTFGLGASMLLAKTALADIGGFGGIAEYLADDYQLGFRLWKRGYANTISTYLLENRIGTMAVWDHLVHQMRWSRTYRTSRPAGYLGYGITHLFFFALLLFVVSPAPWSAGMLVAVLALRYLAALIIYLKVIRTRAWLKWLPLLPLKDFLGSLVWIWSFAGSTVYWRGNRFRLMKGGKMTRA